MTSALQALQLALLASGRLSWAVKATPRMFRLDGLESAWNSWVGAQVPEFQNGLTKLWDVQRAELTTEHLREAVSKGDLPESVYDSWRDHLAKHVNGTMSPVWRNTSLVVGKQVGDDIIDATGARVPFGEHRTAVNKWVEEHGADLVVEMSQEQRSALREVLRYYIADQPLSPGHLQRVVQPLVGLTQRQANAVLRLRQTLTKRGKLTPQQVEVAAARYAKKQALYRAKRIARTELAFAMNQGQRILVETGLRTGTIVGPVTKEWITSEDELVCPVCGPKNSVVVGFDEDWDGVSLPPAHPFCRCTHACEMPEEQPLPPEEIQPEPVQPEPVQPEPVEEATVEEPAKAAPWESFSNDPFQGIEDPEYIRNLPGYVSPQQSRYIANAIGCGHYTAAEVNKKVADLAGKPTEEAGAQLRLMLSSRAAEVLGVIPVDRIRFATIEQRDQLADDFGIQKTFNGRTGFSDYHSDEVVPGLAARGGNKYLNSKLQDRLVIEDLSAQRTAGTFSDDAIRIDKRAIQQAKQGDQHYLRSCYHEAIHATGARRTYLYGQPLAKFIEETSTEMCARNLMRFDTGAKETRAYQSFIDRFSGILGGVTSEDSASALSRLERACIRFRRNGVTSVDDLKKVARDFANQVDWPDKDVLVKGKVSKAKVEKLRKQLVDRLMLFEEESK